MNAERMIFTKLAKYYDLLYRSRNIVHDINLLEHMFKEFTKLKIRNILDLGCGTGDHALELARRGYRVIGLDISREMIHIANTKKNLNNVMNVEFRVHDIRNFNLGKKFDVVIALYGVISYLVTSEDIVSTLRNVRRHLVNDGLFIFDFWHLSGQIKHYKPFSIWKYEINENEIITKLELMSIDITKCVMKIAYEVHHLSQGIPIDSVFEEHELRLFTMPEITRYLDRADLKILKTFKVHASKYTLEKPDKNTCQILCITKPKTRNKHN